jgi:hypothetical protein
MLTVVASVVAVWLALDVVFVVAVVRLRRRPAADRPAAPASVGTGRPGRATRWPLVRPGRRAGDDEPPVLGVLQEDVATDVENGPAAPSQGQMRRS